MIASAKGQLRKYVRAEVPALGAESGLGHTPDAVFALARGEQSALFFLELDRGTEVIGSADHGVGKIVRFYLRYLLSDRFQRYQSDFGACAPFRGFRALIVTTTAQRVENIRERCGVLPFTPSAAKRFIWLAAADLLTDGDPLTYQWRSLDPTDGTLYRLAPTT